MSDKTLFVARERELAELDHFLQRSLAGEGAVCFVTGEAGSGKTALVNEFAHRAQVQHDDLISAVGQCDAQTGTGDPYLPFRELLSLLSGDVDSKLAQGDISEENAGRLRQFLRYSGQALVELGPDLLDIFVPGAGIATRAGTFLVEKVGWLDKLQSRIDRSKRSPLPTSDAIRQENILEQYTNVLIALAQHRPLLLILDDLQWADTASTGLLFRLGRRLGSNPILLVGTYRPAEVALGRDGERHPLDKVLAEFKRYFGDVRIELDQTSAQEGRHFVDAFLDTEPNQLGGTFRQELFHHTRGHPLFSIELLRAMQERGDLVQNAYGEWVKGPTLDWGQLPTRVEGVIEERIARLEAELRETLTLASVEGENFTAETIARVQQADARHLVRRLSSELEKQHQLVASQRTERLEGGQRISHYRFQHNLFQRYLYGELEDAERAYLHEDVGTALEALYGECADEIALQLARHFVQAGVDSKARVYLGKAGRQAAARYANDQALGYLDQALNLTPASETAERYELLAIRERIYSIQGTRDTQAQDLAELATLAEELDDDQRRAEVALASAGLSRVTGDYGAAIDSTREAIQLAHKSGDLSLELAGGLELAITYMRQGQYESAHTHAEECLRQAQSAGLKPLVAKCLENLGIICCLEGKFDEAQGHEEKALEILREIDDRRGSVGVLNTLGGIAAAQGDYPTAGEICREGLKTVREIGDRLAEGVLTSNLGELALIQGDYQGAAQFLNMGIELYREIEDRRGQAATLALIAQLATLEGDDERARGHALEALKIADEIGDRSTAGYASTFLGYAQAGLDNLAGAVEAYERALAIFREIRRPSLASSARAGLARLALKQGDLASALEYVTEILPVLDKAPLEASIEPFRVYLTCYHVMAQADDPRALETLTKAQGLLRGQAARISDPDARRTYLEEVAVHKALLEADAEAHAVCGSRTASKER